MGKVALIVVDVQRDFCEGGALPAADTLSLLRPLQDTIQTARRAGAAIVYTKDWHPKDHSSYETEGGPWPVHCAAGTPGAELMPPLQAAPDEVVIHKGVERDGAGYSGFELTGLDKKLKELDVDQIAVTGIATEYCVRATALDALKAKLPTVILIDLIRAVQPSETGRILEELRNEGAKLSTGPQWLKSIQN
jgi:nicotinamidase/pyrazinamidase